MDPNQLKKDKKTFQNSIVDHQNDSNNTELYVHMSNKNDQNNSNNQQQQNFRTLPQSNFIPDFDMLANLSIGVAGPFSKPSILKDFKSNAHIEPEKLAWNRRNDSELLTFKAPNYQAIDQIQ